MAVIEVKNLVKNYKDFQAVKSISFEVQQGEIFGILGPNGAGKTTTLEIIEALKRQNSGECIVLGLNNLTEQTDIKKRIGVQLQNSEYLNNLTLKELVELFAGLYGQKVNPAQILNQVGLESKLNNQVKELSGGQKQRFTIASALVHKPEILILDEPTTGLDPAARRSMWQLIKNLNEQNITIVLTTHYMEEAEYLCDRVAIMDQGKILEIDNPRKLIEQVSSNYKLSFFVDRPLPENLFDGIPGLLTFANEYPKVAMEISGTEILPTIMQKLGESNVNYSFLNLKTATLEDVYLQLTGHEYED